MSVSHAHSPATEHSHGDSHDHHELSFLQKYVFSTDHKVIGIQYGVTGLAFLFFGFMLMLVMRWQLAHPGEAVPFVGDLLHNIFGNTVFDETRRGVLTPDGYNTFGAMHGTIMVFFGVVPVAFAAFGNYVVPLQIGAPDMCFPKLNMASFWSFFVSCVIMVGSFFVVWAQFVTAFLLLLAFPPLEAAGLMQFTDRVFGTSFFMPTGLAVAKAVGQTWAGGGSPVLWQHLFWFLAHPEVYVLILPAIGMVAEIVANNTRKPLYGYKSMVYAVFALGFLSFIVWAHHMYMTGMGAKVAAFFQATTILISVPSVILLTSLILSLWGGSIRFNNAMLFAAAFLPMFGIGGLTGIPLAFNAVDLFLHDTYYVIGHFHYVVAPGTIFAIFAGVYHWYPKATGRHLNEFLGRIHFWGSLVAINGLFFPMFIQGMAGVHRRWYDGGVTYEGIIAPVLKWNNFMTVSAMLLALFQLPFIYNFFSSIFMGQKASDNPWDGTTLEWETPTPPPHGNFVKDINVVRGPYEYSVPGESKDFLSQNA